MYFYFKKDGWLVRWIKVKKSKKGVGVTTYFGFISITTTIFFIITLLYVHEKRTHLHEFRTFLREIHTSLSEYRSLFTPKPTLFHLLQA